jgi:hypothetical protein
MQRADFKPVQFGQQLVVGGQIKAQFQRDLEFIWGTAKLGP